MNIDHSKLNFISGPDTIIKLEGKINNVYKNIILLGEHHYRDNQNECPNIDSIPIKNYLIDIFKKSTKDDPIDFFLHYLFYLVI